LNQKTVTKESTSVTYETNVISMLSGRILQNSHSDERIEISGEKVRNGVIINATKIVLVMSIKA